MPTAVGGMREHMEVRNRLAALIACLCGLLIARVAVTRLTRIAC